MSVKKTRFIENRKELGVNLKMAREKAELTQNYVSEIIGVNRSNLAYYEIGRTIPTIFTLIKLSEIYNVSLLDLIAV